MEVLSLFSLKKISFSIYLVKIDKTYGVFQTPYLLAELGYIFVPFVSERACVVSVTFFKCCFTKSNVGFS